MSNTEQQIPVPRLWPLRQIEVRGLFGRVDLPLPLDQSATILTGENGSGKSTVLQAVDHAANGRWAALMRLPLNAVVLTFDSELRLLIERVDEGARLTLDGETPWLSRVLSPRMRQRNRQLANIREHLEMADTEEERRVYLRRYEMARARAADLEEIDESETPPWVTAIVDGFSTKLISARRLEHQLRPEERRPGEERPLSVVDRFAAELATQMRDELSRYATESRRQEKALPSQIVEAMQLSPQPDSETLAVEVDQLRAKVRANVASLTKVGLFQEEDPDQRLSDYPRDNTSILLAIREVYRVTLQRLERLRHLRSDLELFSDFMNERLSYKRIELNQRDGIDVVLDRGDRISPSRLSSGEQQLLALGFELLFRTEPHSVVLLDEPELSLHVGWLQGLMSAFLDMGESRGLQFVVATHSGSVLAGHQDRERSLDEIGTGTAPDGE